MIEQNAQPTAQEASDVSTCVFDGVDAIMLNEETSNGEQPIQSVNFLSKICAEAERCIDYKATFNDIKNMTGRQISPVEGLAAQTVKTSQNLGVDLIVVQTETGVLPRLVAKYKPSVGILACSTNESVLQQLSTTRGILKYHIQTTEKVNDKGDKSVEVDPPLIVQALNFAKERNYCKSGRKVLYLHGMMGDQVDQFAMKEIVDVE